MYQFPIGVIMDSFRMDTKQAIEKAAAIGAKGLQMYATQGEHAPENLSPAQRRELLDMVKSHGMVFSALCGDLGVGFGDAARNPELIEKSKRIIDLAKELETDIVTTHVGVIPEDPEHPQYKIMQEACFELSRYADSIDAHFAIETGPETAKVLRKFLDSLHSRGVAVNLDPANFVMVAGDDPVRAVYELQDYIVHTHAKDGIKLTGQNGGAEAGEAFRELPLGEGGVPFPQYLKALEEVGYRGFLTIEREVGDDPAGDIAHAADFLRNCMKEN